MAAPQQKSVNNGTDIETTPTTRRRAGSRRKRGFRAGAATGGTMAVVPGLDTSGLSAEKTFALLHDINAVLSKYGINW